MLCEILCNALFGSDDEGGTFVQLDGTKKEQLLEKFNAHLSRTDVILVDELSKDVTPKDIYEKMKKSITDEKLMVRRMREAYTPEKSHMLWILTTNHEYAIEITDAKDRRHVIIRCDDGYLHLPNPPEFHSKLKEQMADGGKGRLVSDIKNRPLKAAERVDGKNFEPSDFSLLPEVLVKEREKALNKALKRPDEGHQNEQNDIFFQTLKKDVNEISFTRMLLSTSAPPVNGMHIFNWNTLSASNCFYDAGKSLYEEYKKQRGDSACMSTTMFAQKLKEIGLVKAQKRLKIGKKGPEVVWVGFTTKRGE